jgi:tetratricopeptide (TPR) repeat protein
MVRRANPKDVEAQGKARTLAAEDTIARGNYEEAINAEQGAAAAAEKQETPPPAPKTKPVKIPAAASGSAEVPRLAKVENNPMTKEDCLRLAADSRSKGQIDEARSILEQGLKANAGALDLVFALEDLEIEPLRRSLAHTEEKLRSRPRDDKLLRRREELQRDINARELDCYRRRTEHDPSDRSSRFELGVRLVRAGREEEAISEFQAARSDPRLHWKALMYLGQCFQVRRNWPLSKRNLEEALRTIPEGEDDHRKELLFLLARGHADAGELPRAIELALELADRDYSYRNIGRLLEEWQARVQVPGVVGKQRK